MAAEKSTVADEAKITGEQQARIIAWLNEKAKNHHCPVCETNSWSVPEHLVNLAPFHQGGALVIGGAAYPAAMLVCNNCAYVRQFMAVPIGLLEDEEEPPREASGDG